LKKVLFSVMSLMVVVGLVGGGAFAYFSDTETSTANSFAAGTLDLKLNAGDSNVTAFTVTDTYPSASGNYTYDLSNTGSLDGYLDVSAVVTDTGAVVTAGKEFADGIANLGTDMMIRVTIGGNAMYQGSLIGFNGDHDWSILVPKSPGATTCLVEWWIPESVGNEIQGDSASIALTFELAQTIAQ
jgi:spore coat-associated protein N